MMEAALRRISQTVHSTSESSIGVLNTLLQMIEEGATHVGVATDHVISSGALCSLYDDRLHPARGDLPIGNTKHFIVRPWECLRARRRV